jgi:hypothetical protein
MPEYGKNLKKVVFADTDKRHADLKIRLRYDGLTQLQFFQSIVTGYIEKDPRIVEFFLDVKRSLARQGKAKIDKSHSIYERGEFNKALFKLTDEESDEIFDLIAEEFSDI